MIQRIRTESKMKLSRLSLLLAGSALVAGTTGASAQVFTPGDLVVSTYGSATSTSLLDGQATAITLTEFSLTTPTSAAVAMTDVLPTSGTGANVGIVGEYGSSSEGTLQVSGNGQYLTIGGYDGNIGANAGFGGSNTALAQSTDTALPRVAAVINLATGSVNTSTVLNDVFNTNNPRSVYSPDGTTLLISGQGAGKTDEGGIYSTTTGTNTTTGGSAPTPIFNTVSTRTVSQSNVNAATGTGSTTANTYYSADQNSGKGVLTGIFEYSGTPTGTQGSNTGTRITPASGTVNGRTVNYSPQGFVFANATTLYVADTGDPKAGGVGDGGIQKWSFEAGTWTLDYTLAPSTFVNPASATSASSGETGFEDLALTLNGDSVDISAVSYTAGDANPNGLYAIQDSLSAATLPTGASTETFTELAEGSGLSNANGQDENFKGIAIVPQVVPEPSTTSMLILTLLGGAAFAWKRKNARRA
jgi:hypothetical protein